MIYQTATAELNNKRRKYVAIRQIVEEANQGKLESSQNRGYWLNEAKNAKFELEQEAKRVRAKLQKGFLTGKLGN